MIKMTLAALSVSAISLLSVTGANAAVIALEDWWLQTDAGGGLRQSTHDEEFFFAVAQLNTRSSGDTYETPDGYRWATTAEAISAFTGVGTAYNYVYYNQNGWSGYSYEGQTRYYFIYSDSDTTFRYNHSGTYDHSAPFSAGGPIVNNFAGLVLIREEVSAVPLPAALPLLGAGLGLLGVAGRRRKG
jgi:hypothetical protein